MSPPEAARFHFKMDDRVRWTCFDIFQICCCELESEENNIKILVPSIYLLCLWDCTGSQVRELLTVQTLLDCPGEGRNRSSQAGTCRNPDTSPGSTWELPNTMGTAVCTDKLSTRYCPGRAQQGSECHRACAGRYLCTCTCCTQEHLERSHGHRGGCKDVVRTRALRRRSRTLYGSLSHLWSHRLDSRTAHRHIAV